MEIEHIYHRIHYSQATIVSRVMCILVNPYCAECLMPVQVMRSAAITTNILV